jgi:hypothetical protein
VISPRPHLLREHVHVHPVSTAGVEEFQRAAPIQSFDDWSKKLNGRGPFRLRQFGKLMTRPVIIEAVLIGRAERRDTRLDDERAVSVTDQPIARGRRF